MHIKLRVNFPSYPFQRLQEHSKFRNLPKEGIQLIKNLNFFSL